MKGFPFTVNKNGSGPGLSLRSPIRLEGKKVLFIESPQRALLHEGSTRMLKMVCANSIFFLFSFNLARNSFNIETMMHYDYVLVQFWTPLCHSTLRSQRCVIERGPDQPHSQDLFSPRPKQGKMPWDRGWGQTWTVSGLCRLPRVHNTTAISHNIITDEQKH